MRGFSIDSSKKGMDNFLSWIERGNVLQAHKYFDLKDAIKLISPVYWVCDLKKAHRILKLISAFLK
jgi:hypothetical protein